MQSAAEAAAKAKKAAKHVIAQQKYHTKVKASVAAFVEPHLSASALNKLIIHQLEVMLRRRGMKVSGKKQDLIERLLEASTTEEEESTASVASESAAAAADDDDDAYADDIQALYFVAAATSSINDVNDDAEEEDQDEEDQDDDDDNDNDNDDDDDDDDDSARSSSSSRNRKQKPSRRSVIDCMDDTDDEDTDDDDLPEQSITAPTVFSRRRRPATAATTAATAAATTSAAAATATAHNYKLWNDLVRWVSNSSANAYDNKTGGSDDDDVGEYVHPSLVLKQEGEEDEQDNGSSRGVFTTTNISKGELLIRIPSYLIISGELCEREIICDGIRKKNGDGNAATAPSPAASPAAAAASPASPWLKCTGEYLRIKKSKDSNNHYYQPYMNSLPTFIEHETLHNWSSTSTSTSTSTSASASASTTTTTTTTTTKNDTIDEISSTLGNMILHDRTNSITKIQYKISIEPYLNQLGLLLSDYKNDDNDKNYELFLEASMCVSTRGFYVYPSSIDTTNTNTATPTHNDNDNDHNNDNNNPSLLYNGPFLLPVIDLINHSPNMACTSLQRIKTTNTNNTSTNSSTNTNNSSTYTTYFTMIADRNITSQEEIYHSYGTNLTSSQLLQTFGFIPVQYTACVIQHVKVEVDDVLLEAEEAKKGAASLMRPFNEEEQRSIQDAIYGPGHDEDIISQDGMGSVQRQSMQTLKPETWLNDEVIHYFYLMLSKRDEELCKIDPTRQRSHFFKSFFITKILNEGNASCDGKYEYRNVKRWSKKVPGEYIFKLDKILFPINMGNMHWIAAVIFMKKKRIKNFDSMGSDGSRYLNALFSYIQDEHMDKKKTALTDIDEWKLLPTQRATPRQRNGHDCGVFTCMFVDFLSRDTALVFNQTHINQCRERIEKIVQ